MWCGVVGMLGIPMVWVRILFSFAPQATYSDANGDTVDPCRLTCQYSVGPGCWAGAGMGMLWRDPSPCPVHMYNLFALLQRRHSSTVSHIELFLDFG